jgi:hypothetical protein
MALQPRYTAVPAVPLVGIEEWQSQLLNAMKENIELLTGTRGEPDLASVAINRARLTVAVPPAQSMVQVSAQGSGVTISGANIPILEDYVQLITDVQKLANDVANLRATVEVLITQLRG